MCIDFSHVFVSAYKMDEVIAWYANNTPTSATTPIYRFHSQKYNAHFFTMSDTEKDHIIHTYPQTEWNYEGIAWYGVR